MILIVDDDFGVRESVADALRDESYSVATARDGQEALDYLSTNPLPSLILLDWMMPRCDGAQFRSAQLSDPRFAHIPVVLLTADVKLREKMHALQATGYLAKPVDLDDLLAT